MKLLMLYGEEVIGNQAKPFKMSYDILMSYTMEELRKTPSIIDDTTNRLVEEYMKRQKAKRERDRLKAGKSSSDNFYMIDLHSTMLVNRVVRGRHTTDTQSYGGHNQKQ